MSRLVEAAKQARTMADLDLENAALRAQVSALTAELAAALANKAKLREAVEPFKAAANRLAQYEDDSAAPDHCPVTYGDYRRARRAYEETA